MSDLEELTEFVEYAGRQRNVGPRRYLRYFSDPFTKYTVAEFQSRYRFTPYTIKSTLLPMLEQDLKKPTMRGLPFAPEIMVLVTLRFYATGCFQMLDGDTLEIRQQCVSRIVTKVSQIIAMKMKYFVKFPSTEDGINTLKHKFYEIAQFPGVIGCIDCTHIKIRSPGGMSAEVYRNRKGWFSVNVQAVVGPNLEFQDLVARWPGSSHDSFIYNSSAVKQRLGTGVLKGILLGDSGYAVSNVLLTPFLSPNTNAQEMYNKSQIKTRNTVERAFGVWKRKFPCLQVGMGLKLATVVAVICACATLHNLSIAVDDLTINEVIEDNLEADVAPVVRENTESRSFIARQSVVDRFFS